MDLYAINCLPTALKRDGPMPFIAHTMCAVVDQTLRGLKAIGCKWSYLDTRYWMSIMTVSIMRTIVEHPMTVSISWRWASTERQQFLVLPFRQSQGSIVTFYQTASIGDLYRYKAKRPGDCHILEISVIAMSMMFGLSIPDNHWAVHWY